MASRLIQTIRSECGRVIARIRYCSEWQEYSVNIYLDGVRMEEATYLTNAEQDAIDSTSHCMQYAMQFLQPELTLQPK